MEEAAAAAQSVSLSDSQRHRGLLFIRIAAACVGVCLTLQLTMNSNFLVQEFGVSGFQAGLLEAVRESCGVAALGVLALIAGLTEPVIATAVLLLVWVGLSAYAFVPTYGYVMLFSLVWSLGFHVWTPLPSSMTLALAEPGRSGARLGAVAAAGAIGSGVGLALAFLLTTLGVPIRPLYVMAGAAGLVGAAACLGIPRKIKTPGPSFIFRRRYSSYYALNFLEGWRKQIAVTFAGFLLVKNYGARLTDMILLWACIQGLGWFTSPRVGRLIDRIGERRILLFYYGFLTLVFVGYSFLRSRLLLYGLYVLDSATFAFATALTTYVGKLAPKHEHTPTLSMGVAMNHVASVTMPFVGGLLWGTLGYRWAFLMGLPAAAASILIVLRLPRSLVSGRPGPTAGLQGRRGLAPGSEGRPGPAARPPAQTGPILRPLRPPRTGAGWRRGDLRKRLP
jgi:predicted MFS family arabinose efflux permease